MERTRNMEQLNLMLYKSHFVYPHNTVALGSLL